MKFRNKTIQFKIFSEVFNIYKYNQFYHLFQNVTQRVNFTNLKYLLQFFLKKWFYFIQNLCSMVKNLYEMKLTVYI